MEQRIQLENGLLVQWNPEGIMNRDGIYPVIQLSVRGPSGEELSLQLLRDMKIDLEMLKIEIYEIAHVLWQNFIPNLPYEYVIISVIARTISSTVSGHVGVSVLLGHHRALIG